MQISIEIIDFCGRLHTLIPVQMILMKKQYQGDIPNENA